MTSFEKIVRPFQSKDVTPPQVILDPAAEPLDNVKISCGATGETKTFSGSFSLERSYYVGQQLREVARETTTKRITNPDDPSQYVDVETIDKILHSGTNSARTTTLYKNTDPA